MPSPPIPDAATAPDDVFDREDEAIRHEASTTANTAALNAGANEATRQEHDLSTRDAVKLYKPAIFFSLAFSLTIIMEGYGTALVGTFYGFQPFLDKYGDQFDPEFAERRIVSAHWQSILAVATCIGSIIGLCVTGWISEKFGFRKTLLGSLFLTIVFALIPFLAQNLGHHLVGTFLQGLPWGVFQALAPTYASEVMPVVLRPYLTTYVNLGWLIGQLIASVALRAFLEMTGQWAYRIPFAIQWLFPIVIVIGIIRAPESPWLLCRQGRDEDARIALRRLTSQDCGVPFDVDKQLAMIKATNDLEMATSKDQSYLACFRGTDLRRTEITCVTWITQAWCGAGLMGISIQLYRQAGLPVESTFDLSIAQDIIGIFGSIASWFLMARVGRRTIYLYGLSAMFLILLAVGGCGLGPQSNSSAWGAGSLILVYTFFYNLTIGSVGFSIVAEIPSTRLKSKTVPLARSAFNVSAIVVIFLVSHMIGPQAWNWDAKTGFFWAGACVILFTWCYFRLPEPKGRTFGELELLFERKISARKFASTNVGQFSEDKIEPASMPHAEAGTRI